MSILYKYIEENDNELFEFNLLKHFSSDYIDELLNIALKHKRINIIKLLTNHPNYNPKDYSYNKIEHIIQVLLNHPSFNINNIDFIYISYLYIAIHTNDIKLVKNLLSINNLKLDKEVLNKCKLLASNNIKITNLLNKIMITL